jgi:hypothetical protein
MLAQLCLWLLSLGEARTAGRPAARPAKPRRRARLGLEVMEAREVPSAAVWGGYLVVTEGSGFNSVSLDNAGGGVVKVTENGSTTGTYGGLWGIGVDLTGNWGAQYVYVNYTPPGAYTEIFGGGGFNYVAVGGGNLDNIGGNVSFWGNNYGPGDGTNTFVLSDSANWASVAYDMHYDNGGATVTRYGGARAVDFHFDNQINTFYLFGSQGSDTYSIYFTLSHDTFITLGSSYGSRNYMDVGLGSAMLIQGYLHINGGNHNTDLVIDDSQDTAFHDAYLHSGGQGDHVLSGLRNPITWSDGAIRSYNIYAGPHTGHNGDPFSGFGF